MSPKDFIVIDVNRHYKSRVEAHEKDTDERRVERSGCGIRKWRVSLIDSVGRVYFTQILIVVLASICDRFTLL